MILNRLTLDIFGGSHEPEIGMTLGGVPEGTRIDEDAVRSLLERRKSGSNPWSTPRKEADTVCFLSGVKEGFSDGGIIKAVIKNTNVKSGDYSEFYRVPRPSHADYAARCKGYTAEELAGGGRFSGRMTAPYCVAGAIALGFLAEKGVEIGAYIGSIGGISGASYKEREITFEEIRAAQKNPLAVLPREGSEAEKLFEEIAAARSHKDSLGGTVECIAFGLPIGLGDALFEGLEGKIAYMLYAIPAVKGVEFGEGFGFSALKGNEANDCLRYEEGKVVALPNKNGGINGGISNGMPLTLSVAFKPTPSIGLPQKSVDLDAKKDTIIEIGGRHDACIVPRALPVVESAVALALMDAWLGGR